VCPERGKERSQFSSLLLTVCLVLKWCEIMRQEPNNTIKASATTIYTGINFIMISHTTRKATLHRIPVRTNVPAAAGIGNNQPF
jgi:hypothetical protein